MVSTSGKAEVLPGLLLFFTIVSKTLGRVRLASMF
jgi:hypothetical protein